MMTADNRRHKIKKRHQIGSCRFRSGEAMLIGITFSVMRNMIMNNEFKQFREIIENRNWSVVAHSGMFASFKYGYNSRFLPHNMEVVLSQAQVKDMPKNRNKNN
jgi:hypothetical protein